MENITSNLYPRMCHKFVNKIDWHYNVTPNLKCALTLIMIFGVFPIPVWPMVRYVWGLESVSVAFEILKRKNKSIGIKKSSYVNNISH